MMILGCLRGAGKLNEAKIKSIVETFSGGDSLVSFADSTLTVRVLPPSWGEIFLFPDVEKALSPLVPAHVTLSVERYYNTWAERVSAYGSWGAIKSGYDAAEGDYGESFEVTNLITNGNFTSTTGWTGLLSTISAADNMLSIQLTGAFAYGNAHQDIAGFTGATGKIIYTQFEFMVTNSLCLSVNSLNYNGTTFTQSYTKATPTINTWYKAAFNFTMDATWAGTILRQYFQHTYADKETATGKIMKMQNALTCDLTATFGAGNEPTAAEMEDYVFLHENGWFDGTVDWNKYAKFANWAEFRNLI